MTKSKFEKMCNHIQTQLNLNGIYKIDKEDPSSNFTVRVNPNFVEDFNASREDLKLNKLWISASYKGQKFRVYQANPAKVLTAEESQFGIAATLPANVFLAVETQISEYEIEEEVSEYATV